MAGFFFFVFLVSIAIIVYRIMYADNKKAETHKSSPPCTKESMPACNSVVNGLGNYPPQQRSSGYSDICSASVKTEWVNSGEKSDAWEGTFREGVDAYEVNVHLNFDYIDLNGTKTNRTVWVREADDVLGMMLAYCELRGATRTFRYSSVSNCVDIETGEVINDVGEYLYNTYLTSPEYALLKFTQDNLDLVKCLLYMAKADGQMRKEERDIISQVCISDASSSHITEETIKSLLSGLQIPSMQAFKLALGKIANNSHDQFKIVAKAAKDIVNTQKTIHPNEQAALDYIAKKAAAAKIAL